MLASHWGQAWGWGHSVHGQGATVFERAASRRLWGHICSHLLTLTATCALCNLRSITCKVVLFPNGLVNCCSPPASLLSQQKVNIGSSSCSSSNVGSNVSDSGASTPHTSLEITPATSAGSSPRCSVEGVFAAGAVPGALPLPATKLETKVQKQRRSICAQALLETGMISSSKHAVRSVEGLQGLQNVGQSQQAAGRKAVRQQTGQVQCGQHYAAQSQAGGQQQEVKGQAGEMEHSQLGHGQAAQGHKAEWRRRQVQAAKRIAKLR